MVDSIDFEFVHNDFTFESKKAVLLFHGLTGSPFEMRKYGDFLFKNGYDVFCYSFPGHGEKIGEIETVTWQDWCRFAQEKYDNLISLSGASINIISMSDGQEKYSGLLNEPLEINLTNDKYKIDLFYSGYKILDRKNIELTDFIEIQTQNSKNLTDVEIIIVPETLFENNNDFQNDNENLENDKNEENINN